MVMTMAVLSNMSASLVTTLASGAAKSGRQRVAGLRDGVACAAPSFEKLVMAAV
jgi:hypothetical protein